MRFEYVDAATDTVMDTVTVDDGKPSYDTGKARRLVESMQADLGDDVALDALRDWSNGYVLTREVATR